MATDTMSMYIHVLRWGWTVLQMMLLSIVVQFPSMNGDMGILVFGMDVLTSWDEKQVAS